VQINGKTKTILLTNPDRSQQELIKEIKKNEKIDQQLKNKKILKLIYIKNRIINFVIEKQ